MTRINGGDGMTDAFDPAFWDKEQLNAFFSRNGIDAVFDSDGNLVNTKTGKIVAKSRHCCSRHDAQDESRKEPDGERAADA